MIKINDDSINLIKSFEGFFPEAYHGAKDKPGIFTIGYGTIRYTPTYLGGRKVQLKDPKISEQQAFEFLKWEVEKMLPEIDDLVRDDLTINQFNALTSFCYNLGTGALKQSHLREKLNKNPKDPAIRDEFMKWTCSNGECGILGLIRRRKAEANLYFK